MKRRKCRTHKARNRARTRRYRRPKLRHADIMVYSRNKYKARKRRRNPSAALYEPDTSRSTTFAVGDRVRFTQRFATAVGVARRIGTVKKVREARSRQGIIQIVKVQWASRDVTDVSAYNLERV